MRELRGFSTAALHFGFGSGFCYYPSSCKAGIIRRKMRQILFRTISRLVLHGGVVVWRSAVLCWGGVERGSANTQTGKHLQVRFKEANIVPVTEAAAALVRGLLSDFRYQHVIQVPRSAGGFWPVSEWHFKIAALFFLSFFLFFKWCGEGSAHKDITMPAQHSEGLHWPI